ncbi:MAG: hypothetical protein M3N13_00315, partial [Candidatus Eremiobacteraeota bacterium]|nr:hypothetical protein [Candidatus Eremiobacteraeota bacterium]
MGISLPQRETFLVRALVASMVLHLLFAYFVPTVAWLQSQGPTVESLSFVRVVHISVATPLPAIHPPSAAAPQRAAIPRIVQTKPLRSRVPNDRPRTAFSRGQSQAPALARATAGAAAPQAAATGAPSSAPQEKVATAETRHDAGGYMP